VPSVYSRTCTSVYSIVSAQERFVENSGFVCLYADNSNLFIEGKKVARNRGEDAKKFRLYFPNLISALAAHRKIEHVVWGGSIPPKNDQLWDYLRKVDVEPDLLPRSETGENETVDHLIQLRMYRHARQFRDSPGTIVLLTGDGKGYFKNEGFLYDIEGFVNDGWAVEVASWDHCCNAKMREFAKDRGKYIKLDDLYEKISFISGGRVVSKL